MMCISDVRNRCFSRSCFSAKVLALFWRCSKAEQAITLSLHKCSPVPVLDLNVSQRENGRREVKCTHKLQLSSDLHQTWQRPTSRLQFDLVKEQFGYMHMHDINRRELAPNFDPKQRETTTLRFTPLRERRAVSKCARVANGSVSSFYGNRSRTENLTELVLGQMQKKTLMKNIFLSWRKSVLKKKSKSILKISKFARFFF